MKKEKFKSLIFFLFFISVGFALGLFYKSDKKKSFFPSNGHPDFNKDNIIISLPLFDKSFIKRFNSFLTENDRVEVRSKNIEFLNEINNGVPVLLFGKKDDPEEIIKLAKKLGIKKVGYNLEKLSLSKQQLLDKQKEVYLLAQKNNLEYSFGPMAIHILKYNKEPDLAVNSDGVMIQLRNFQLQQDFPKQVKQIVENLKKANPDMEIQVQIDISPNDPSTRKAVLLSKDVLIKQIEMLKNEVEIDLVSFWVTPNDSREYEVLEALLSERDILTNK